MLNIKKIKNLLLSDGELLTQRLVSIKVLSFICAKRDNPTVQTTRKNNIILIKLKVYKKRFSFEKVLCTYAHKI